MYFNKLIIHNLFAYKHSEVMFSKDKKYIVLGVNNDDSGSESNGSGKSSLFNAIYFILYGKVFDKRNTVEILRLGETKGYGTLILSNGMEITRTITAKGAKNLTLKNCDFTSTTTAQDYLNEVLGCDSKVFLHSHYMSSDFSKAFVGKETKPDERFKVFEEFINSEFISKCESYCANNLKIIKSAIDTLNGEISGFTSMLDSVNVVSIKKECDKLLNISAKVTADIQIIKEDLLVQRSLKEQWLEAKNDQSTVARIKQLEIKKQELLTVKMPEELTEELSNINSRIRNLKAVVNLVMYKCPTCSEQLIFDNDVLKKPDDIDIAQARSDLENLIKEKKSIDDKISLRSRLSREINSLDSSIIELENSLCSDKEDVVDINFNEKELSSLENELKDLRLKETELNSNISSLKERLINIETIKEKLAISNKNLEKQHNLLSKFSYWKTGFKQIKANRINSIIPMFEYETNILLNKYFDSSMTVTFKTNKELQSGKNKIELNIDVEDSNGDIRSFESFSTGQKGRIAVAVTLARKIILGDKSSLELMMVDEIFDMVDSSGQEKLVDIINSLDYQVFLISHSSTFKDKFIDKIEVNYENGISSIM